MKINEKINYISPKVEVVKVKIEKGFELSRVPEDGAGFDIGGTTEDIFGGGSEE